MTFAQAGKGLFQAFDLNRVAQDSAGAVGFNISDGFGLDLGQCAASGATEGLAYVSPKSGRAVSEAGAGAYRDRLLPLPPFLLAGGPADWEDIFAGFRLTGHFLARDLLIERQADVLAARERLLERLRRVMR